MQISVHVFTNWNCSCHKQPADGSIHLRLKLLSGGMQWLLIQKCSIAFISGLTQTLKIMLQIYNNIFLCFGCEEQSCVTCWTESLPLPEELDLSERAASPRLLVSLWDYSENISVVQLFHQGKMQPAIPNTPMKQKFSPHLLKLYPTEMYLRFYRKAVGTSCCPEELVSRTGRPMQTFAVFIELRLSWAKVDLQVFGVLSSAAEKKNQTSQSITEKNDSEGQNLKHWSFFYRFELHIQCYCVWLCGLSL